MRTYTTDSACRAAMTRRGATARRREDFRDIEVREARTGGYYGIDRQGYIHTPGQVLDPRRDDCRAVVA